jgi:hypothetical protein
MKSTALSRRDRLRHMLADLRMPGGLEALDAILQGVDGGTLTAPEERTVWREKTRAFRLEDDGAIRPQTERRKRLIAVAGVVWL